MPNRQLELPGFFSVHTLGRFPDTLGLIEAAALVPFARRSPSHAEEVFRKRRGDLTRLAVEHWENTDTRFGDDLTKARLHQLVEMAIQMERQSGIPDFPSVEKQKLDRLIVGGAPSIDSTLKWNLESDLLDIRIRSGVASWYNQIDLIEARQAVDPREKPLDRGHPDLARVLREHYKRIAKGGSVYHFGRGGTDPTYAPGVTYAYSGEDRYLTPEHAMATIGLFLATHTEDLDGIDLKGTDYLKGFKPENHPNFNATVRNVVLHEDWLSRAEALNEIIYQPVLAV